MVMLMKEHVSLALTDDMKIVASLTGIGSQRASVWQEGGKSAGVKDTARWDLWEKDREKALCS